MDSSNFQVYNEDKSFHSRYLSYQSKYAQKMRESDKILVEKIFSIASTFPDSQQIRLLDVGCSTGNLLLHIKRLLPNISLVGLDLNQIVIEECKNNPQLRGIDFVVGSALEMKHLFNQPFEIVVANAMVHPLNAQEFEQVISSFASILKPDGFHLNFDGFHPFHQEISVVEYSDYGSQKGIPIFYRSFDRTSQVLALAGFDRIEFHPFEMPFDLDRDIRNFSDLSTYTIKTEYGTRLSMRGSIYQPWCHLYARKKNSGD